MNVHEGKLLGCSYNHSCLGVWVADLSCTEPCNAGDANGHPEKRSSSGRDTVVLNDNVSKTMSASQNIDTLWKETKSLERLSTSQNPDPSTKETKAIGRSSNSLERLSVSQNSDVAKESRTSSSTGSVPSTPHRVSLTTVSKAAFGVYNAATSRRSFTKANQKANPVNNAADFVIVPREDPREQATESRAELDLIAKTMPYLLQAADSRRPPSSRNP